MYSTDQNQEISETDSRQEILDAMRTRAEQFLQRVSRAGGTDAKAGRCDVEMLRCYGGTDVFSVDRDNFEGYREVWVIAELYWTEGQKEEHACTVRVQDSRICVRQGL
jgi:hypothetical protein